jgi:hypothetical protein
VCDRSEALASYLYQSGTCEESPSGRADLSHCTNSIKDLSSLEENQAALQKGPRENGSNPPSYDFCNELIT